MAIITLPAGPDRTAFKNLRRAAGEDLTLTWLLTPVRNVAGWTVQLTVTDRAGVVRVTKSVSSPDQADGVLTCTLTAADTGTTLGPGSYNLALERTDAGSTGYLYRGRLTLGAP